MNRRTLICRSATADEEDDGISAAEAKAKAYEASWEASDGSIFDFKWYLYQPATCNLQQTTHGHTATRRLGFARNAPHPTPYSYLTLH